MKIKGGCQIERLPDKAVSRNLQKMEQFWKNDFEFNFCSWYIVLCTKY